MDTYLFSYNVDKEVSFCVPSNIVYEGGIELIELNGREIHMTVGDTASVSFEANDFEVTSDDLAIFTIKTFDGKKMLERVLLPDNGIFRVFFSNEDTKDWRAGDYQFDIRIVFGATLNENGRVVSGRSVMTPFPPSLFRLVKAVGTL